MVPAAIKPILASEPRFIALTLSVRDAAAYDTRQFRQMRPLLFRDSLNTRSLKLVANC